MKKIILIIGHSGISLVQVLIAVGLMGGLALGLMRLSKQQLEGTVKAESNYEITSILNEMRIILSHPPNCKETFAGEVVHPANSTTVSSKDRVKKESVSGGFTDKFIVGERYGRANVKINFYSLSFTADPPIMGEALLMVQFYRGRAAGKQTTVNKKIALEVALDSSDRIETCAAMASGVGTIWQRMSPPDDSNIFYNEGHVGIGTINPQALLHLEAELMQPALYIFTENDPTVAASPTGIRFKNRTSNTPQDYNLSVSYDNNFRVQRGGYSGIVDFSVASNGNVGIGTTDAKAQLHIKGSVMVGNDNVCDSNSKGKLRYNDSADRMEYCSNSGWRSMGGTNTKCATFQRWLFVAGPSNKLVNNHTTETVNNIFEVTTDAIICKNDFYMIDCHSSQHGSFHHRVSGYLHGGLNPSSLQGALPETEACYYRPVGGGEWVFATCCRNE